MDLENDGKVKKLKNYSNIECRYFQCNTKRIINPFNTVGGNMCGRSPKNNPKNTNNAEIIDIFDNSITTPYTPISNGLVQELRRDYEVNTDGFITGQHGNIHAPIITTSKKSVRTLSQPTFNLSTRSYNTPDGSTCSRSAFKTPNYRQRDSLKKYNHINRQSPHLASMYNTRSAVKDNKIDKTTYCRPLYDLHNEELAYKAMQRHIRLQKIVRKLVTERQREKQKEAWNNYINELKNKHKYYSNEPIRICPQYVPNEERASEFIEDYYNTKYSRQQSDPCQNLLKDIYGDFRTMQTKDYYEYPQDYNYMPNAESTLYFDNNRHCYPTASQGRLMMLNRERGYNNLSSQCSRRYYRGTPIIVERDPNIVLRQPFNFVETTEDVKLISTVDIQTDNALPNLHDSQIVTEQASQERTDKCGSFINRFKKMTNSVTKLKKKLTQTEETKSKPLQNIEEKLDALIKSVDSFIAEMRAQKRLQDRAKRPVTKSQSVDCKFSNQSNTICTSKKDVYGLQKTERILFTTVLHNNSTNYAISEISTSTARLRDSSMSRIDKIIEEEMEKSNKIKRDIEELLDTRCSRECSVEIAFDIPTKERSTEVTNSMYKTCSESDFAVEEINNPLRYEDTNHSQVTIAVNTDPLSLLALLRVSTEAIKQFLSYMPNLNYYSYLPLLQLPLWQLPLRPCAARYVCNVCGVSFDRPTQLSDHIQKHNLGRTRDCCVCRHVLYKHRGEHMNLFHCMYCGQCFTRAYCCELHQRTCAKRFGKIHDVTSNLLYLR